MLMFGLPIGFLAPWEEEEEVKEVEKKGEAGRRERRGSGLNSPPDRMLGKEEMQKVTSAESQRRSISAP